MLSAVWHLAVATVLIYVGTDGVTSGNPVGVAFGVVILLSAGAILGLQVAQLMVQAKGRRC